MFTWKMMFAIVLLACSNAWAVQDVQTGQRVWFAEPADGAVVSSPFKVKFEVAGMKVMPAGDVVRDAGHHHLLIDCVPVEAGKMMPYDATHIHYGFGETETTVALAPGTHTLTVQFARGDHKSFGEAMSKTITVTVK
jgi:hypothetical protein